MARVRDRRQANWFWMNKNVLDDYGPKIGANGIAVYAFLARCANEQGHAIPSIRYIAKHVGLSTNTVMKYITILEDHGLIEAQKRRDEAGDMTSTEYILLTPSLDEAIEGVSTSETPKEPEVSQPLGDRVSTSETFQEPLKKITQKENQEVRTPLTPLLTPQSLMELYNTFTPGTHPKVEKLTDARKQKAALYLRQFPDQSFWETVCLEISQSSLLLGLKPSQGHEHFKGTFDWLLTKGKNDQV